MLFMDTMREDYADALTAVGSQHTGLVHENGHWIRWHGSTIGVLLTLLRRQRDEVAQRFLDGLDGRQRRYAAQSRADGRPLLEQGVPLAPWLDDDVAELALQWLDLLATHRFLFDARGLDGTTLDLPAAVIDCLTELRLSGAIGVEPLRSGEPWFPPVAHRREKVLRVDRSALSTRLLLECASLLDEAGLRPGPFHQILPDGVHGQLDHKLTGGYAEPIRQAAELAGRELSFETIHLLIDLALNPSIPGLDRNARMSQLADLYPPARFRRAATAMRDLPDLRAGRPPDRSSVLRLQQEITAATGLEVGQVSHPLSSAGTVEEAVRRASDDVSAFFDAAVQAANDVQAVRRQAPEWVSHYYCTTLGRPAALHVLTGGTPLPSWPYLRVIRGRFHWSAERLTQDQAERLLVGAVVAGAYDDVLSGTGPLRRRHLPDDQFEDSRTVAAMESFIRAHTGFHLSFGPGR
ncbi:hypothetical protein [Blastococcus saxobsidens]|nr:hypothetical protein [Blastococcus saxobsidens]